MSESRHILVVDDSPEFLDFMSVLLTSEGFDVSVAASLDAAQQQLDRLAPSLSLLISDVRLPNADPFAVLDVVQANPTARNLAILFCTGGVQELNEGRIRLVRDRTEIMLKPFDIDALLNAVNRLAPLHRRD